jgi:hypothetical protein
MSSISTWYRVSFDDTLVYRQANPETGKAWNDSFAWADVIRVCFEASEDFMTSDTIYVFTNKRPESYEIPTEAKGGSELWGEIIRRNLFDAELSIKISMGQKKGISCWPAE